MLSCSKGSRGLFVPSRVIGIFTDTTISLSSWLRQRPDHYTIRAGRNLPDKEFRGPNRTTLVRRVAQVNPAVCQGCGACTVACMSGAMDLKGFSNRQIMAEVDAICR